MDEMTVWACGVYCPYEGGSVHILFATEVLAREWLREKRVPEAKSAHWHHDHQIEIAIEYGIDPDTDWTPTEITWIPDGDAWEFRTPVWIYEARKRKVWTTPSVQETEPS